MSSGIGSPQAVTGSGYTEIEGKRYLKLKKKGETAYDYVVMGENRDIYRYANGELTKTEYSLNANFEVLLNGEIQKVKQMTTTYDSTNGLQSVETDVEVNMNIMYSSSEFQALNTTWLYMKYSDNDGKTWSDPIFLNDMVKSEEHRAFVVGPGRGTQITTGEYAGRLIVPVYSVIPGNEWMAGVIYSDDHGMTWAYAEGADVSAAAMTETQVVEMPDGSLRVFARSNASKIATAVSTDGGETWTAAEYIPGISQPSYGSQLSVIRSSVNIDGKPAIILSTPVGGGRNDGRIKIGLITDTGAEGADKYDIEWKYDFEVDAPGVGFAYSCLSELGDGNIGILYEKYDSYNSGQLQTKHAIKYEEFTMNKLMGGEVVTVTTNSNGNGTVSEKSVLLKDSSITVTATPDKGYGFVKWTDAEGNLLSKDAEYTFTATEDTIVNAVFEQTVKVTVESVLNASGAESVAALTGSGVYIKDSTVTVTAPAKVGYEFKGWYVKDVAGTDYIVDKKAVSTDYSYSFVAEAVEEVNLVAVYVATEKLLFTLTDTTDVEITIEEETMAAAENTYVTAGEKVTVAYTGEAENFLYWKNASGKIVSTEAIYSFDFVNNMTLTPVVKAAEVGASALVEYVNEYEQVLLAETWTTTGKDELSTAAPSKLGYTFAGWAFAAAPATVVDADGVRTAIATASHIRLVPVFKADVLTEEEKCTVTYNTGTGEAKTDKAAPGELYTVTADTVEGQKFSHWTDGNGIVSYSESYTFLVTENVTVTAVFVGEETTVEKASVLEISSKYEIKNGNIVEKVAFVASREIAEGYTLLEHGILYAKDSEITNENDFVEGVEGINKFTANGTGMKGAFTLNVRVGSAESNIKARAYAVVKENSTGKIKTIYSTTISTYVISK